MRAATGTDAAREAVHDAECSTTELLSYVGDRYRFRRDEVHTQIARSLHISYAALLDQLHSLSLNSRGNLRRSMSHLRFHLHTFGVFGTGDSPVC
jgi:hypothetical protein